MLPVRDQPTGNLASKEAMDITAHKVNKNKVFAFIRDNPLRSFT